jgi:hypothetical protein
LAGGLHLADSAAADETQNQDKQNRIHPTHRDKAAMNGAPGYCLKTSIHLLPAECRVLVFKPGQCVLKML